MQCASMHAMPLNRAASSQRLCRTQPFTTKSAPQQRFAVLRSSTEEATTSTAGEKAEVDVDKQIQKFTRQAASTFAPRPSTAQKNPAVRGSTLYWIFEYQAWIAMAAGALLSYNVLFPTDAPSIPRLLGMWSIWMFTIPSLRARECLPKEKDALNLLFILVPLMNITLPFVWKSFPFIFTADVVALFGVYTAKGVWEEVYGLPIKPPSSE